MPTSVYRELGPSGKVKLMHGSGLQQRGGRCCCPANTCGQGSPNYCFGCSLHYSVTVSGAACVSGTFDLKRAWDGFAYNSNPGDCTWAPDYVAHGTLNTPFIDCIGGEGSVSGVWEVNVSSVACPDGSGGFTSCSFRIINGTVNGLCPPDMSGTVTGFGCAPLTATIVSTSA